MPRYKLVIHGQNFRLNLEGRWEKHGFFTPRCVEAPDPLLAEHVALEDFRHSRKYQDVVEATLNSEDDPPVLSAEEIEEIVPGTEPARTAGLAFYPESEDDEAEPDASPHGGPDAF